MKCPMKFNSTTLDREGETNHADSCMCEREECGWYDPRTQSCAIHDVARCLEYIRGELGTIASRGK